MVAAINAVQMIEKKEKIVFSEETIIGALSTYISTENKNFQPMNANFGILNCDKKIKDKVQKYTYLAERSLAHFDANNK